MSGQGIKNINPSQIAKIGIFPLLIIQTIITQGELKNFLKITNTFFVLAEKNHSLLCVLELEYKYQSITKCYDRNILPIINSSRNNSRGAQ